MAMGTLADLEDQEPIGKGDPLSIHVKVLEHQCPFVFNKYPLLFSWLVKAATPMRCVTSKKNCLFFLHGLGSFSHKNTLEQ